MGGHAGEETRERVAGAADGEERLDRGVLRVERGREVGEGGGLGWVDVEFEGDVVGVEEGVVDVCEVVCVDGRWGEILSP